MNQCINCCFHRYKSQNGDIPGKKRETKLVIAFPVNTEMDFEGEVCLKDLMQPVGDEVCKSYKDWCENKKKKQKNAAVQTKKDTTNGQKKNEKKENRKNVEKSREEEKKQEKK